VRGDVFRRIRRDPPVEDLGQLELGPRRRFHPVIVSSGLAVLYGKSVVLAGWIRYKWPEP
jgi:hypothetical protein